MADSRAHHRSSSVQSNEDDSLFADPTRQIEAFGRKVTATAGHLISPFGEGASRHYENALGDIHRELRRPMLQKRVFSMTQVGPAELVRSKLVPAEIQHLALAHLPDAILEDVPENAAPFSLFQGFEASLPDGKASVKSKQGKTGSRGRKLLGQGIEQPGATPAVSKLRNEKESVNHRLEMLEIRKNMCSTEIREIDGRIANLNSMRKIVLDRLADLEQDEVQMEEEFLILESRLEEAEEEAEDLTALSGQKTPTRSLQGDFDQDSPVSPSVDASFMSESIYQKLPSPKSKRPKQTRRRSTFILHEHLQAGSKIRDLQAHNDTITALDFDAPFGTMVSAALDDTVRVWDLNAGRCMGLLEGHLSSVRCLQVEDNIVATGSLDATVRFWDLSQADYIPPPDSRINKPQTISEEDEKDNSHDADADDENDEPLFVENPTPPPPPPASMADCPMFTLSAHVAEVTALHFHNSTLVSGSADKTLRQWDLEKGRCVQTLDVLWAAAQASATVNPGGAGETSAAAPQWRQVGRGLSSVESSADFVGALQCFDAALACGTADGMVRLWDLRSGQVHRSLVGHTGPVTCLQFDDVHLVTGSLDRSIRIWDLRTGSIFDAFAFANPVTSMMFDTRRIIAATGEDVVKVYDKADGNHWDCGAGASPGDGDAPGSVVERVRIKDGYMVEGRKDGIVGIWSC